MAFNAISGFCGVLAGESAPASHSVSVMSWSHWVAVVVLILVVIMCAASGLMLYTGSDFYWEKKQRRREFCGVVISNERWYYHSDGLPPWEYWLIVRTTAGSVEKMVGRTGVLQQFSAGDWIIKRRGCRWPEFLNER